MNILHLSSHYPDNITPNTTWAIKNLIDAGNTFSKNHCISIHNARKFNQGIVLGDKYTTLNVWGMPLVVGMRNYCNRCVKFIINGKCISNNKYNFIHAHRLSVDGGIAYKLAKIYKLPFCVSVRATDFQLLRFKPYLKKYFIRILCAANSISVISPWLKEWIKSFTGNHWDTEIKIKTIVLSNVVDGELIYNENNNNRYIMISSLSNNQLKRKNIFRTLKAIQLYSKQHKVINLDIVGSGNGVEKVLKQVKNLELESQIKLVGKITHAEIPKVMSRYKALILCSFPETFGLVYIEALKSGIPIIHTKDTGVDGLFTHIDIASKAKHSNTNSIVDAINKMESNYYIYKSNVKSLHDNKTLSHYSKNYYSNRLKKLYSC